MSEPVSYQPLNNVATTDSYPTKDGTSNAYRSCPGCVRVNFDVANATIYYQLGYHSGGSIIWRPERFLVPGFRSFDRQFDAIRVRSAVSGQPAQVTVDVLTPHDVGTAP